MSNSQAQTIQVISSTLLKVVLAVCGTLLTISYIDLRNDIKSQGKDITEIKIELATLKTTVKFKK